MSEEMIAMIVFQVFIAGVTLGFLVWAVVVTTRSK